MIVRDSGCDDFEALEEDDEDEEDALDDDEEDVEEALSEDEEGAAACCPQPAAKTRDSTSKSTIGSCLIFHAFIDFISIFQRSRKNRAMPMARAMARFFW